MTCKKGHILNYDGYCRVCQEWLVDPDGPNSPFGSRDDEQENEHEHRGNDGRDDVR
jgi:hypothetical protein